MIKKRHYKTIIISLIISSFILLSIPSTLADEPLGCLIPKTTGDTTAETIDDSPFSKKLECILENNGILIIPDADNQTQYQKWNFGSGVKEVTLNITYLGKEAGYDNVFGYMYEDDINTFTPLFQNKTHPGYTIDSYSPGMNTTITIPKQNYDYLTFAIATEGTSPPSETGLDYSIFSTLNYSNWDNHDHSIVLQPSPTNYTLCFEDLPHTDQQSLLRRILESIFESDNDYDDMVVNIEIESCNTYDLTINKIGPGTVTPEGTYTYYAGSTIDLEATPESDCGFVGWIGDFTSSDNKTSLTMNKDREITAVFSDNTCGEQDCCLCWAQSIEYYKNGTQKDGTKLKPDERNDSTNALCQAQFDDTLNFVSLGFTGEIILNFSRIEDDRVILNETGDDILVVETSWNSPSCTNYPEYVHVYASQDNITWDDLGVGCLDSTFDLADGELDLEWARYVKLTDATNPNDFNLRDDGFDIDGVFALHCGLEPNPTQKEEDGEDQKNSGKRKGASGIGTRNRPAIAEANGPYEATAGETVQFTAAGSKDPDDGDTIVTYEWKSDDVTIGYGETLDHVFENDDIYSITLTVTSSDRTIDTDPTHAEIIPPNRAPIITNIGGAQQTIPKEEHTYTIIATDPDKDTITYTIDWGDGTTETSDPLPSSELYTTSHQWTTTGIYEITVTASDGNLSTTESYEVTITETATNIAIVILAIIVVAALIGGLYYKKIK